ncbi:hypothetical protein Q5752_005123 [Cryptotrichosporon argae]
MLPATRRALLPSARAVPCRWQSTLRPDRHAERADTQTPTPSSPRAPLTGSAKLFADAVAEEGVSPRASRYHLRQTQGPIWDGDESMPDAVLRMLVDAHKPLRTGEGIKPTAADDKIKRWMAGVKLEPRVFDADAGSQEAQAQDADAETANAHRTTIPPHLHRPWHATYTGDRRGADAVPQVKYGQFIQRRASADDLRNSLELQLPPGADGKTRAKVRAARRAGRVVGRLDSARERALDYKIGSEGEVQTFLDEEAEEEARFMGNRQIRGSSALGAQRGAASGVRAWAGLVEDRIQHARSAGFFNGTAGRGAPLAVDPEASNPHLETGERLMNRIVKRQGALPPWIELQNSLDSALNSFRATLRKTYVAHVVRDVISAHSLHALPPLHAIPASDPAWEAREQKFHDENVRQINELVRRMNAQAPSIARRGLVSRELELERVRGEGLKGEVWAEIRRRAADLKHLEARGPPGRRSLLVGLEGGAFGRASQAIRSLWTRAGAGKSHDTPRLLIVAAGVGVGAIYYLRRPARNDSESPAPASSAPPKATHIVPDLPTDRPVTVLVVLQTYLIEPISTFFRFIHLALLFGPVILSAPMLLVGSPPRRRHGKPVFEEDSWGAVWWYGFLVKQMERAGPSFIKLGQWAASRADLFPAALCDKMSKLHSNGAPHPLRHTKRVIEKAFQLRFDEIFEEFGEEPIGCGAIAQVYKAKLRPEIVGEGNALSTSVAIKVLHPRARKTIRRDIAIMSVFANMLNALPGMQWLSLPEEVAVFGEMMNSQLDLRVEAANLNRFAANFAHRGRSVTFPRPIKLAASEDAREVLVEEFEDALPLKHFLRQGGGPYDDKIANIGLDAFLEMLLLDNWTHGDLHPGNIMVRFVKPTPVAFFGPLLHRAEPAFSPSDPADTALVHSLAAIAHDRDAWLARLDELDGAGYVPQLVFIDAGLVTSLDAANRRNFLDLFQAVAEFDGYKAGKLMIERCRSPEFCVDEETFALKIQHLVLSVKSKTFSLAKIKISDILTDVLTAVRQHHVKLEGDFVNTVISILLLEGIGRQLDPNMDLFKSALPILRQLGRQMGTREAIAAVPRGNIWAMAKLWIWAEAREVVGEATEIDKWIRYDRFMPAI